MMKYSLTHKLTAIFVICMALLICVPKIYAEDTVTTDNKSQCEQKVALLNYRSKLLAAYKQSEDKQYKLYRKKWANRITYAGQWVSKDSQKTRDSLYNYDNLHKELIKEIDKQIKDYQYLETDPLNCSDAKKDALNKKLEEVRGRKGKKAVGGQALLDEKKKQKSNYEHKKFEKKANKMIKNLHKEKKKNPKAEKSMTIVKDL